MSKITLTKISTGLIIALFIGVVCYQAVGVNCADQSSPKTEKATALYQKAKEYDQANDLQMAREAFQQVIQQYPDTPDGVRAKLDVDKLDILIAIESGDPNTAMAEIDKIIADFSTHSDLPATLCRIANKYWETGKYKEAKSVYQKVIERFPNDQYASRAQVGIGLVDIRSHIYSNNIAAAETVANKLATKYPEHAMHIKLFLRAGVTGKRIQLRQRQEAKTSCQHIPEDTAPKKEVLFMSGKSMTSYIGVLILGIIIGVIGTIICKHA